MTSTRATRSLLAALLVTTLSVIPFSGLFDAAGAEEELATVEHLADPDVNRQLRPEDQYAMALGCYELANVATGQLLGRQADAYADGGATPFHFEPTALGTYLLLDVDGDVLAAAGGPYEQAEDGIEQVEYAAPVTRETDIPGTFFDELPSNVVEPVTDELPAVDTHTGAIVPGIPSPSADWRARHNTDGTLTFTLDAGSGRALAVVDGEPALVADGSVDAAATSFQLTSVDEALCAEWPEIEIGVDGPVLAGATPWDETRGYVDGHLHLMAFEFLGGELRCGRPWHPYGVQFALGDCADNELTGARLAEMGVGDGPDNAGDDVFWPEFTVPTNRTLTYEQVYHRWLERAWRGGLRMMTVLMVENNVLCEAWYDRRNSCNEMDSVRLQIQRMREFVDYLDARGGGPGEGWAEIVTDPFQARRVINEGKLAFILGIEVSTIFDCGERASDPQTGEVLVSECTDQHLIDSIREVRELGITQVELVNKFDNALSGVKGDGGSTGVVVGAGNFYDTGHWWRMQTCEEGRPWANDRHQTNLVEEADGTPFEPLARDPLAAMVLSATGKVAAAPLYPAGPHCNIAGLTRQGELALRELAAHGMIFDPDHMSTRAAYEALNVMEEIGYSGVFSSHGWADDLIYERVYDLGGTVTQYAGGSGGFANGWRKAQDWIEDDYYFGYGYGADMNGLGGQGGPRNPAPENAVTYPFTVPGGAVVTQQVSGVRAPYDINTDGVAHYGMYPDWTEDLRMIAGEQIISDMLRGPESYLQMWERAVGVAKDACAFGVGEVDGTDALAEGMTVEEALWAAGQPRVRDAETFTWCGLDASGNEISVTATWSADGRIASMQEVPQAHDGMPPINQARQVLEDGTVIQVRDDVHHDHGAGHDH